MARTVNDILKHANELADRFQAYEPDPTDEISVAEYQLGIAAIQRARIEQRVIAAVADARRLGLSWRRIGSVLGTSHQAAQTRYAHVVKTMTKEMAHINKSVKAAAASKRSVSSAVRTGKAITRDAQTSRMATESEGNRSSRPTQAR